MSKKFILASDLVEYDIYDLLSEIHAVVATPALAKRAKSLSSPPVVSEPEAPMHTPGHLEMASHAADDHFHHPQTKFKSVRHLNASANEVFHGTTHDGKNYIMKPLSGGVEGHDPEHWVPRNVASNRVLDAMGHGHMGVETFHGTMPGEDRMKSGRILPVDPSDSPEKRRKMHATHVGGPALVTKYADDTITANEATPEQLAKVDGHHRLAGLVHHVVMGNVDGHHKNVLINTQKNHPVHIDGDLNLSSSHQREYASPDSEINLDRHGTSANPQGKRGLMSLYSPHEDLDYRKGKIMDPDTGKEREMGEIGHNYPDHIKKSLEMAAAGKLGHGLSDEDHAHMIGNARDLLNHGLEGTLQRRHMVPTYRRRDQQLGQDVKTP